MCMYIFVYVYACLYTMQHIYLCNYLLSSLHCLVIPYIKITSHTQALCLKY